MNITGEIKYFLGSGDYAQLRYSETGTSFSIDIVMVPSAHRNKGIGSTLVSHVLLLADSMKKDVYLSARPIGTSGEEELQRLISYYQRFGFEVTDRAFTTAYMVRKLSHQTTLKDTVNRS